VLDARRAQKAAKAAAYGARVLASARAARPNAFQQTIDKTVEFFESLGIPTRLSAYGAGEEVIPRVVANLKANRRLRMGEKLDITPDEAGKILTRAL